MAAYSPRAEAQNWTITGAPITNWTSVACSADGRQIVAAAGGIPYVPATGPIYISRDSGHTWSASSAPALGWAAVASSSNGSILIAATSQGGSGSPIYISTNSGNTWVADSQAPSPFGWWQGVSCSSDGNIILAGSGGMGGEAYGGRISISTNGGSGWTSTASPGYLTCVGCSGDGRIMMVGVDTAFTAPLQLSTNSGVSWFPVPVGTAYAVACSYDGTRMIANNGRDNPFKPVYTSSDTGKTWAQVTSAGVEGYVVAMSADGRTLTTAASNLSGESPIFVSHDFGSTWTSNSFQNLTWASLVCSAEGSTIVAAVNGGGIYTWHAPPRPGTVLWSYDTGNPISSSPALSPDGATVYVGSGGSLMAITNLGSVALTKWVSGTSSAVVGADGTVYYCSETALVALNPADGSQKWSYSVPSGTGDSPAMAADGTLYFEGSTYLYAVSPTGQFKWKAFAGDGGGYRSPVVGPDGTVYLGIYQSSQLRAYAPDGAQKWVDTFSPGLGDSPGIGTDGTVYVGADKLYALGLDGSVLWSSDSCGLIGLPAIGGQNSFYMNLRGRALARINTGGQTAWNILGNAPQYGTVTGPAIDAAGIIYYCVSNSLWAVSPQGQVQWAITVPQLPPGGNLSIDLANVSPAIGPDGTIYAGLGSILYAVASGTNGPANTSWPMYRGNAQHTGKIERPFLAPPQKGVDSNFTLQLYPNQLGLSYGIESSINLSSWTTVTNVMAITLPTLVTDLSSSNAPTRFYRASLMNQ